MVEPVKRLGMGNAKTERNTEEETVVVKRRKMVDQLTSMAASAVMGLAEIERVQLCPDVGVRAQMRSTGSKLAAFSRLSHSDMLETRFVDCFIRLEAIDRTFAQSIRVSECVKFRAESHDRKVVQLISVYILADCGKLHTMEIISGHHDLLFSIHTDSHAVKTIRSKPEEWERLARLLVAPLKTDEDGEADEDSIFTGWHSDVGESFLLRALLCFCPELKSAVEQVLADVYPHHPQSSHPQSSWYYRRYPHFREFWSAMSSKVHGVLTPKYTDEPRILPLELTKIVLAYSFEFPIDKKGVVEYVLPEHDMKIIWKPE